MDTDRLKGSIPGFWWLSTCRCCALLSCNPFYTKIGLFFRCGYGRRGHPPS
nr:MAG TPA: hypothetical protein [Caudoviricetes sp.]